MKETPQIRYYLCCFPCNTCLVSCHTGMVNLSQICSFNWGLVLGTTTPIPPQPPCPHNQWNKLPPTKKKEKKKIGDWRNLKHHFWDIGKFYRSWRSKSQFANKGVVNMVGKMLFRLEHLLEPVHDPIGFCFHFLNLPLWGFGLSHPASFMTLQNPQQHPQL